MSLFRRQSTADSPENQQEDSKRGAAPDSYAYLYDPDAEPPASSGGQHLKRPSPWTGVNLAVLTLHIMIPVWLFWMIGTLGVTSKLVLPVLGTNLLLGIVYKLEKSKPLLYLLRVLAIAGVVLFYVPTTLNMGFSRSKWLYPLKRDVFAYGVSGRGETLPEHLPAHCEGYCFFTQSQAIAQDYHPSAYLAFYTDPAVLEHYAASYGGERTETKRLEDYADEKEREYGSNWKYPNCPAELPNWVISVVEPTEDLHGAVMYRHVETEIPWYSGTGMILDYDSGYVIFWT